jgi:hypothetical protein
MLSCVVCSEHQYHGFFFIARSYTCEAEETQLPTSWEEVPFLIVHDQDLCLEVFADGETLLCATCRPTLPVDKKDLSCYEEQAIADIDPPGWLW